MSPRLDSLEAGLCDSCPHLVSGLCNTSRACGQVLACRSQKRAIKNGRFPSGRVRSTPPKRVSKDKPKNVWAETNSRMREVGGALGLVWIKFFTRSQQVTLRRCLKSGKMTAVHLDGVNIHGIPATFIVLDEVKAEFGNWELPCVGSMD